MSIIIKGMAMPKDCFRCPIWNSEYGRCRVTARITNCKKDCPLIEVKTPHGRLGDLDELIEQKEWAFDGMELVNVCDIINAPTIIEAEVEV